MTPSVAVGLTASVGADTSNEREGISGEDANDGDEGSGGEDGAGCITECGDTWICCRDKKAEISILFETAYY